jgi:hypothetical protein
MCYVEASYYIHCTHLNVHFWTCTDLEHGHLRPKSVLHTYHRLCPACFEEKYVRPEGEVTEDEETPVGSESEDGLETLPVANRPTASAPSTRELLARLEGTTTRPTRQPLPAPTSPTAARPGVPGTDGFPPRPLPSEEESRAIYRLLASGRERREMYHRARNLADFAQSVELMSEERASLFGGIAWDPATDALLENAALSARRLAAASAELISLFDEGWEAGQDDETPRADLESEIETARARLRSVLDDTWRARSSLLHARQILAGRQPQRRGEEAAERHDPDAAEERRDLEAAERRAQNLAELVRIPGLSQEELLLIDGEWDSGNDELLEIVVESAQDVESLRAALVNLRIERDGAEHQDRLVIERRIESIERVLPRLQASALELGRRLLRAHQSQLGAQAGRERRASRVAVSVLMQMATERFYRMREEEQVRGGPTLLGRIDISQDQADAMRRDGRETQEHLRAAASSSARGGEERRNDQGGLTVEPALVNTIRALLLESEPYPGIDRTMSELNARYRLREATTREALTQGEDVGETGEQRSTREPHPWDPPEEIRLVQQAAEEQQARIRALRAANNVMLRLIMPQAYGQGVLRPLDIRQKTERLGCYISPEWVDYMRRHLRELPDNFVSEVFRQEQEEFLQAYERRGWIFPQARSRPAQHVNELSRAEEAELERQTAREVQGRVDNALRRRRDSPRTPITEIVQQERDEFWRVQRRRRQAIEMTDVRQRNQEPSQAEQAEEERQSGPVEQSVAADIQRHLPESLDTPVAEISEQEIQVQEYQQARSQVEARILHLLAEAEQQLRVQPGGDVSRLADRQSTPEARRGDEVVEVVSRDESTYSAEEGEITEDRAVGVNPVNAGTTQEGLSNADDQTETSQGIERGDQMQIDGVDDEPAYSPDQGTASARNQDPSDYNTTSDNEPPRPITPRPASRSTRRLLRWTAFETHERHKWPKICHERNCTSRSEHHDDAKSLLQARQFKQGADATLDDLDNDTARHLVKFNGCGHVDEIMLEKVVELSIRDWAAKCGCKIPMTSGAAVDFLVRRTAVSREKCLLCDRQNTRQRHFSQSVRRVESEEIEGWRSEMSEAD